MKLLILATMVFASVSQASSQQFELSKKQLTGSCQQIRAWQGADIAIPYKNKSVMNQFFRIAKTPSQLHVGVSEQGIFLTKGNLNPKADEPSDVVSYTFGYDSKTNTPSCEVYDNLLIDPVSKYQGTQCLEFAAREQRRLTNIELLPQPSLGAKSDAVNCVIRLLENYAEQK